MLNLMTIRICKYLLQNQHTVSFIQQHFQIAQVDILLSIVNHFGIPTSHTNVFSTKEINLSNSHVTPTYCPGVTHTVGIWSHDVDIIIE